jgi:hypothetical protein
MKKYLEKIISLIIIFTMLFTPAVIFAQEVNTENAPRAIPVNENPYGPGGSLTPEFVNSQIQNSILTTTETSSTANTGSGVGNASAGLASCLGAQVVSKAITTAVTNATTKAVSKVTDLLLNVPTAESGNVGANITTETSARVGTVVSLFGIGGLALPSWDSMAYCIVNGMIIYIADSTIQWINTGFEGNPAFLANPDQFFKDIVNQEKIAFIQNLAYGVNSGVCDVFKSSIVSAVLSRYGQNQRGYSQGYQTGGYGGGYGSGAGFNGCPFDQNPGKLNLFVGGNFTEGGGWDSWFKLTQNPQNNPYDTYFNTNDRLNSQTQAVQLSKTRELNWNNGYLSFRKCENETQNKKDCPITTPGTMLSSKINSTLNLGTNRLVLAEKFDQVVTAVVDQLITTALDKTLEAVNN